MNNDRIFDISLTALSLAAIGGSLILRRKSPDAALMPLISSVIMALSAGKQVFFPSRRSETAKKIPLVKLSLTLGLTALFAAGLLTGLNFYLCAAVFLFALPLLLKKGEVLKSLIFAGAGTLILYLVFGLALGIVFD